MYNKQFYIGTSAPLQKSSQPNKIEKGHIILKNSARQMLREIKMNRMDQSFCLMSRFADFSTRKFLFHLM